MNTDSLLNDSDSFQGKKIYYVTNNSSKTRMQIVEKCQKLGFPADMVRYLNFNSR
jgi:ribonucleotide monophosphatase NagD (HAD superfamily)